MAKRIDHPESAEASPDDAIDAELLQRVAERGDRAALAELYRRYYHALRRFIYRITGDIEAAQEGVNDVMLVVWGSASSFAGRSKVGTWIMGIAYRKALQSQKKATRWTARFKAAEWSDAIEPHEGTNELSEELSQRDLLGRVLEALSPKHRAVVELTYFYGCSYDEIAEIVGCPENTVKTRMFHARAKLKEALAMLDKDVSEP
jgi:RNA polymerase sigma factor (sigma-70 family)